MNRRRDRDPTRVVALTLALLASTLILPPPARPGIPTSRPEAWVARIASTKRDREALVVPWISDRPEWGLMLSLEAHRPLDVAVGYTQRLLGHHAEYLLTTARGWGAPLDRAVLEVDWPDSLGAPRFSLPFVSAGTAAGRTLYRFEVAPFRPDTDLVVGWGE